MTLDITPRAVWGARHEAGAGPAPTPAREVWLHHSVTMAPDLVPPFDDEYDAMRTLEEIGERRFGRGISYTFAGMPTGRLYEGHGVDRLGAHTAKRNGIARAIVWVGNYDTTRPTPQLIEATAQLLVEGYRRGWWLAPRLNGGHQQAPGASTACPGRHGMAAIGGINARAAAIAAGTPAQEDEMLLTTIAPGSPPAVIPLPPGARTVAFAVDEDGGGANVRVAAGWGEGKYRSLDEDMSKVDGFTGWIPNGVARTFPLAEVDETLTVQHHGVRASLGVLVTT